tara:strand:+ start:20269 stop:22743 length:2475 start_codon:yes stop_codon:yes gene_type:complete
MKRQIQIYIEGTKIDLFEDEQIIVNSTIQNISDISKIFCDFSQSFTIPATNTNNKIFHHWYNSDVYKYNDVQFNVQTRKAAKIDVNLTPFRSGKIQLEKVNIKDGKPESYQVAFYGDITTLKDLFGEDKLSDLDLSSLDHTYTGTEVINRISDDSTDYDVRYPLISSKDLWTWQDGGNDDITTVTGQIAYTDLFPAVKVSKLFEAIEAEYSIDFIGNFLNDERFKKLFLWCKNVNTNQFVTQPKKLDLTGPLNFPNTAPLVNQDPFNYSNETLTLQWDGNANLNSGTLLNSNWHTLNPFKTIIEIKESIKVSILPSTLTATIYLDMYINGLLVVTQEIPPLPSTAAGLYIDTTMYDQHLDTSGNAKVFHWEVRATQAMNITGKVMYQQDILWEHSSGLNGSSDLWRGTGGNAVTLTGVNYINNYVPDIKVSDFFTGVLKMFNLTCFSTDGSDYNIESIEAWYNVGDLYDTTKYTDIESIEMSRLSLYKKIAFEYQQSNSFLNKQFSATHQREYGNMIESFTYDGGEYKIQVPFENLLGQRFQNSSGVFSNTQVAYSLDENYNPYIPKPCLFYMRDKQTTSIKINDGSSTQTVTNYMLFGQDMYANNFTPYSLNFRNEISSFLLIVNPNGLYATYYANYLMNMYQLNNRLVTLKSIFPVSLLTKLKLNDRLKIRDKRYIINSMKSNINSGEVDLTLIMDFRPVNPVLVIPTNSSANCVDVPVDLYNNVCSATITTTTVGVTITPSTITSSQIVAVCVPVNANTKSYIVDESNDSTAPSILFKLISTEDDVPIITEQSSTQTISLLITQTYCNGAVTENTIIIQQP